MSWISEANLNAFQKFCLAVIKTGNVPRHVAFIMDGNRRFAVKQKVRKSEGHSKGFNKLTEVLKWCLDLGVVEVTVYAFSIENFKRSKEEVDELMGLAREKFRSLLKEKDKLMEEGVRIRIVGDLSLIPNDLFQLMSEIMCSTQNNSKLRLTVAFAYTARNEIVESIRCVAQGVQDGKLKVNDISTGLLEKSLYTEDSETPDLMIRTSGEVRLSDFLLWQSSCSCLYFSPALWPEFSLWEFLKAVFHYQRSYDTLVKLRRRECELIENERTDTFLSDLYKGRLDRFKTVLS